MDKNKIIEAATKFVQKGQYDKAIKEYLKLLEADPKDSRILQKIGELYQKKGDNAEAANYFLKVGESYTADGFFLKAVAVYKQVLKLDDKRTDVNLKLAELYQQLGLMSDAMAQLQIVSSVYEKNGDNQASLDLLKRMVELDPDNIASRIKLAELYARDNIQTEAVNEFTRAATYLKRNNRVDDYIKVAERLVFLDPNNTELARELAQIYLAKQDTKRALAKLQLCFKADPRDIETLNLLAQAFLELGQTSKTVSVYKELAKIYDETDKVDEERAVWEKIREIAPDDPEAQNHLAPPEAAQAAAAPAASQAAASAKSGNTGVGPAPTGPLSPEQITKLLTETDVYVKYGLHDKALDHLKKVFAADPNNLDGHDKAYALAKASGQHQRAEEELATVIRLAIDAGDYDRARGRLQNLLESNPGHAEVAGFLEVLGSAMPVEEEVDDSILIDSAEAEVVEEAGAEIEAEPVSDEALEVASGGDEEVIASHDDGMLATADEALVPEEEPPMEVSQGSIEFSHSAGDDEALVAAADPGDEQLTSAEADPYAPADELVSDVVAESSGTFDLITTAEDEALAAATAVPDEELVAGSGEVSADEVVAAADDDEGAQSTVQYTGNVNDLLADAGINADEVMAGGDEVFAVPSEDEAERDTGEITSEHSALVVEEPAGVLDDAPVAAADDEDFEPEQDGATRVVNLADLAKADQKVTAVKLTAAPPEALRTSAQMPAARPTTKPGANVAGPARNETRPTIAAAKPARPPSAPARPVAPPEPEDTGDAAGDELEEASFFIAQGDLETARDILETVQLAFPNNARAKELMAELEAAEQGASAASEPEATAPMSADQSFDLAAELAEELGDTGGEAESQPLQPGEDGFQIAHEDVFAEFKKGVSKVVKPEDGDTHYDLGIAYKEMGLTMDAVGEFEQAIVAFAGKAREIDCYGSIGVCKRELGDDEGAIDAYKTAMALPHITPEATKAMLYETGATYESMNEPKKALSAYQKVVALDPKYRDAAACVARLKEKGIVAEESHNGVHLNGKKGGGSNGTPQASSSTSRPPSGGGGGGGGKPTTRKIGYV
ncbi:MAG: tetratricopeptide repeat protein [Deltaproteobacteria bacterium]|nr:tetratricopeptide repeat protein [Deltaproteobacteria bacterium]